jgi:hypothetical protein
MTALAVSTQCPESRNLRIALKYMAVHPTPLKKPLRLHLPALALVPAKLLSRCQVVLIQLRS